MGLFSIFWEHAPNTAISIRVRRFILGDAPARILPLWQTRDWQSSGRLAARIMSRPNRAGPFTNLQIGDIARPKKRRLKRLGYQC
jgi:hypothetical protein